MPRRQMTPEDIPTIVVVEELDLSVDGQTAVVVRRSIKGNRYLGHLYAIDLGSGRAIPTPRQLTSGAIRDTKPRICPAVFQADGDHYPFSLLSRMGWNCLVALASSSAGSAPPIMLVSPTP